MVEHGPEVPERGRDGRIAEARIRDLLRFEDPRIRSDTVRRRLEADVLRLGASKCPEHLGRLDRRPLQTNEVNLGLWRWAFVGAVDDERHQARRLDREGQWLRLRRFGVALDRHERVCLIAKPNDPFVPSVLLGNREIKLGLHVAGCGHIQMPPRRSWGIPRSLQVIERDVSEIVVVGQERTWTIRSEAMVEESVVGRQVDHAIDCRLPDIPNVATVDLGCRREFDGGTEQDRVRSRRSGHRDSHKQSATQKKSCIHAVLPREG